jgi:hypothetical protein
MATITFLNAVNEVLLLVGENEVPDLAAPVARKAVLCLQSSMRFIHNLCNWPYLVSDVSIQNWTDNSVATLPPIQDILHVRVPSLRTRLYNESLANVTSLLQLSQSSGTPTCYSRNGDTVTVAPRALLSGLQALVFKVVLQPTVPTLASDVMALPDDIYDCVRVHAIMMMHVHHTGDSDSAAQCRTDFENRMHILRSVTVGQPAGSMI